MADGEIEELRAKVAEKDQYIAHLEKRAQAEAEIAKLARQELMRADQTIRAHRAVESLVDEERRTAAETIKIQEDIQEYTAQRSQEDQQLFHAQEQSFDLAARELRHKNASLNKILSINRAISSILELDELLDHVVTSLVRSLEVDRAVLFFSEGDELNPRARRGLEDEDMNSPDFEFSRAIIEGVRESMRPERIVNHPFEWKGAKTNLSLICVPLVHESDLLGIMYMDTITESKSLQSQDMYLAEIFSYQAAISINNSRLYEKIKRQVLTDDFTGLYNRRKLEADLEYAGEKILVLLNVDNFSFINGAYGHAAGDFVLRKVVGHLRTAVLEDGDFPNAELYRVNADEFAVLVKDSPLNLDFLESKIKTYFNLDPVIYNEIYINISFSAGMVEGENTDLMKKSTMALKSARKLGRGRFSVYRKTIDMEARYRDDLYWAMKVKAALEQDRIIPYFQPMRNNTTGKIEKYECLMRMEDEEGLIMPHRFLEAARQTGYFSHLTIRMIDRCFDYFKDKDARFAVNFSSEDLAQDAFMNLMENKLKSTGIDPARVTFEILEDVSDESESGLFEFTRKLREMGFKIAVDDFGKEFSNFARVMEMKPDFIKIDGSFIRRLDVDSNSYKIARAIADFAHSMHARVVAEFVHSAAIQDIVQHLRIEFSQGFYIGEPAESILD